MPTRQYRFIHGFIFLCSLLSGCTQLPLASSCGAWAYGVAGLRANHPYQQCNRDVQAVKWDSKDFSDDAFPMAFETSDHGAPSQSSAVRNLETINNAIVRVRDSHRFDDEVWNMVLPTGWVQAVSPSGLYQHYAYNEGLQAGVFVSTYMRNPFPIFSDISGSLMERLRMDSDLVKGALTTSRQFDLPGVEAYRQEMRGVDRHGVYLHYVGRVIFTKNKVIYLALWCPEERFSQNDAQFEKMMNSLHIKDDE